MSPTRPYGRLPLRLVVLAPWIVLFSFTVLVMAEDRSAPHPSRECWVGDRKIEPPPSAETSVRTLSAPLLLLELAMDALGVSELDESLFREKVPRSSPSTGVGRLVTLFFQIASGSTMSADPPVADPVPVSEPWPLGSPEFCDPS